MYLCAISAEGARLAAGCFSGIRFGLECVEKVAEMSS